MRRVAAALLVLVAAGAEAGTTPSVQVVRVEADGAPLHPALIAFLAEAGVERPDLGLRRPTTGTGLRLPDGHVVTADHVVRGAGRVRLHVPGVEEAVRAEVVRGDWRADLALLRPAPLPGDAVTTSEALPGAPDVAWGAPASGGSVVLWGHADGRALRPLHGTVEEVGELRLPGRPARPLGVLARTAAPGGVVQGDSGGPVLGPEGVVVGLLLAGDAGGGGRFVPGDVVRAWLDGSAPAEPGPRRRWGLDGDARVVAVDGVPVEEGAWPSDRAHLLRREDGTVRVTPPAR